MLFRWNPNIPVPDGNNRFCLKKYFESKHKAGFLSGYSEDFIA
jgi:hypothetical protein